MKKGKSEVEYIRRIGDLESQVKAQNDLTVEHLAELRAKAATIAQLESSARDNRKTIDRMDKETDLYETIIEGLKAEVKLRNMEKSSGNGMAHLAAPLLASAAGVFLGNMFSKAASKEKT